MGPGQQDLRGTEVAKSVLGGDQAGSHLLDDLGDLRLELSGDAGEGSDALAEPGEGLVQYPGLPVGGVGAGERGACFRAPLPRQRAELLAEAGGGGDQDRGQRGAGGLGRTGRRCPGRSSAAAAPRGPRRPASARAPGGPAVRGPRGRRRSGRSCQPGACRCGGWSRSRLPAHPGRRGGGPGPAHSAGFPPRPRSPGGPRRLTGPRPAPARIPRWWLVSAAARPPGRGRRRSPQCACPGEYRPR